MSDYKFKMFEAKCPTGAEWWAHLESQGIDPAKMSDMDFAESFGSHRRLAGDPVVNVWATIFFAYVALTIWINVFPEWTWDFVKNGVSF